MCATPELWTNTTICVTPACTIKEALTAQNISAQICHTSVRNKSKEVEICGPVLCLVAIIFVVIRVIARQPWKTEMFGWDDAFIIVSMAFATTAATCQIFQGRNGLGKDIWTVPFEHITNMLHLFYISEIFYLMATVSTRASILFFYLRVFPARKVQRIIKSVIAVNLAFCLSFFFPLIFQCSPISHAWTRWSDETRGTCINVNAGSWSLAAINMALDLTVLVLPLPILFQLQLTYSWTKKIRIFIMFSSGLIVTIVSGLRLRTLIVFANTRNPTWDCLGTAVWSALELMVGIICACLPSAKVFFTKVAPEWLGLMVDDRRNVAKPGRQDSESHPSRKVVRALIGTNRPWKPLQRTSVIISTKPEGGNRDRGDFMQLPDMESNKILSTVLIDMAQ